MPTTNEILSGLPLDFVPYSTRTFANQAQKGLRDHFKAVRTDSTGMPSPGLQPRGMAAIDMIALKYCTKQANVHPPVTPWLHAPRGESQAWIDELKSKILADGTVLPSTAPTKVLPEAVRGTTNVQRPSAKSSHSQKRRMGSTRVPAYVIDTETSDSEPGDLDSDADGKTTVRRKLTRPTRGHNN